jgi:superfamily II DNA or RNA helicase
VELRPYQKRAYESVLTDLSAVNSTLIVMATGTGKTVLFAHLAKHFAEHGRVVVLAHRAELIYQASDKIKATPARSPTSRWGTSGPINAACSTCKAVS